MVYYDPTNDIVASACLQTPVVIQHRMSGSYLAQSGDLQLKQDTLKGNQQDDAAALWTLEAYLISADGIVTYRIHNVSTGKVMAIPFDPGNPKSAPVNQGIVFPDRPRTRRAAPSRLCPSCGSSSRSRTARTSSRRPASPNSPSGPTPTTPPRPPAATACRRSSSRPGPTATAGCATTASGSTRSRKRTRPATRTARTAKSAPAERLPPAHGGSRRIFPHIRKRPAPQFPLHPRPQFGKKFILIG